MQKLTKSKLPMIMEPPEKVRLMYEAVIAFIVERNDVNSLKVADITGRAGIGKGTAYEYFSTREEIITSALMHEFYKRVVQFEARVKELRGFQSKMSALLDWVLENCDFYMMFIRLFQICSGSGDICSGLEGQLSTEIRDMIRAYTVGGIDGVIIEGQQEGILKSKSMEKCRLAFIAMVVEYAIICSHGGPMDGLFTMDASEARQFVYNGMVRALAEG